MITRTHTLHLSYVGLDLLSSTLDGSGLVEVRLDEHQLAALKAAGWGAPAPVGPVRVVCQNTWPS